ncbi:hypothetical protein GEMRC1_006886 [Eukaryota sp. GEM-RC1]
MKNDLTDFLQHCSDLLNSQSSDFSSFTPKVSSLVEKVSIITQTITKSASLSKQVTSDVANIKQKELRVQNTLDFLDAKLDTSTSSKVATHIENYQNSYIRHFESRLWWKQGHSIPEGASFPALIVSILDYGGKQIKKFSPSSPLPDGLPNTSFTKPKVIQAYKATALSLCQEVISAFISQYSLHHLSIFSNHSPGQLAALLDLIVVICSTTFKFTNFVFSLLSHFPRVSPLDSDECPHVILFPIAIELERLYIHANEKAENEAVSIAYGNSPPKVVRSGCIADSIFILECSLTRSKSIDVSVFKNVIHIIHEELPKVFSLLKQRIFSVFRMLDEDRVEQQQALALVTVLINDSLLVPSIPGRISRFIKTLTASKEKSRVNNFDDDTAHLSALDLDSASRNMLTLVSRNFLSFFKSSFYSCLPKTLSSNIQSTQLSDESSSWVLNLLGFFKKKFEIFFLIGDSSLQFQLLSFFVSIVNSKLEGMIRTLDWTMYGGLLLEKDLLFLSQSLYSLVEQPFSSLFTRLNQISFC